MSNDALFEPQAVEDQAEHSGETDVCLEKQGLEAAGNIMVFKPQTKSYLELLHEQMYGATISTTFVITEVSCSLELEGSETNGGLSPGQRRSDHPAP